MTPHVRDIHIPAHLLGLAALTVAVAGGYWSTALWFLVFNLWFSGLGVSVGFHRYFSHHAFETSRFWRYVMLIGGSLACQGSCAFWVALHMHHHRYSDQDQDVHSPRHGFWHAYVGWIFKMRPDTVGFTAVAKLLRNAELRFTHRHYRAIVWSWWMLMLVLCLFDATTPLALGALIAGMWAIHQEALINSVCHMPGWGVAPKITPDQSQDVHLLKFVTWGQSMHNHHHARPRDPCFGVRDTGYVLIRMIETPSCTAP